MSDIKAGDEFLEQALAHYRREEQALQEELNALHSRIVGVEELLAYRPRSVKAGVINQITRPSSSSPNPYQGMTHIEALTLMARENQGVVRSAEAAKKLVAFGAMTGNPKNAPSSIYRLLKNSPAFELKSPGVFRLLAFRSRPTSANENAVSIVGEKKPLWGEVVPAWGTPANPEVSEKEEEV